MNRFFLLSLNKKEKGESGEDLGTLYDMSTACKTCGTGAVVASSLIVKIKSGDDLFMTLDGNYLISEDLYNHLKASKIKGAEDLQKVMDVKKNHLPYYHLTSKYTFPKMLPDSEGIKIGNQCQTCYRDGHFDKAIIGNIELGIPTVIVPPKYKYEIKDKAFLEQSDIYLTWECFGKSNLVAHGKYVVRYARPRLIVSEHVKMIMEDLDIAKVAFDQVDII